MMFSNVLFIIIAALLTLIVFLWRKIINNDEFSQMEKLRREEKIASLQIEKSNLDSEFQQKNQYWLDTTEKMNSMLSIADHEIQDREEQIQQMYKHIDYLVETVDQLSNIYEELKNYSFEIYERAVELNLFLINKLRGGFLEDNEEVREFTNQIRTFLQDSQEIQDRYGDIFLQEESENVEEEDDDDVDISMEDFFEDDDDDENEDDNYLEGEDENVEGVDFLSDVKFKIKRNYVPDKYE
jgi:methyl-accepting chemotaxis protein